ncbi:MAG: CorA family divalent cation transporter [Thermoplasmatota archaeon]|nr:CorA family divalent cation transporter [Candidatus Thermoplasmatota archaeon]MBU1915243.1 CorA family divalent cation transporter [Candidatus Thermoplasmatota archaeon]
MEQRERKLAVKDQPPIQESAARSVPNKTAESCDLKSPRAVCVALPHSGKPVRVLGDSPTEFISTLQKSTLAWINFTVTDLGKDGSEIATMLGFSASLVPEVLKGYHADYVDRETEIGIMVPVVKIQKLDLKSYPLLILVRKDLIVTIHSQEVIRLVQFSRYADVYMRKLPESMPLEDKLTRMLVRILDENNSRNFEYLREIEEQGDGMSQLLLDPATPRLEIGKKIYELKHTLITYLNTLWRTLDVLHSLRYGDAALVSDNPKTLAQITLLVEDLNRQISLSEHMSEVLASGLEVLQALYNNQLQILNNRMALTITWLTVLGTAVLVPNTLATIFGYVFNLEGRWQIWTLSVLAFATVGSTFLAYWWVKRWVQLPRSQE